MLKSILLVSLVVLIFTNSIGTVVDGNVNIGKNNTILSAGNYVKGSGNIVVPLDSSFNPFKGDPFFDTPLPPFDPTTTKGHLSVNSHTSTLTNPTKVSPIPTVNSQHIEYTHTVPDVKPVPPPTQVHAQANSKKYQETLKYLFISLVVMGVTML